jgi:hypothetical protein
MSVMIAIFSLFVSLGILFQTLAKSGEKSEALIETSRAFYLLAVFTLSLIVMVLLGPV